MAKDMDALTKKQAMDMMEIVGVRHRQAWSTNVVSKFE